MSNESMCCTSCGSGRSDWATPFVGGLCPGCLDLDSAIEAATASPSAATHWQLYVEAFNISPNEAIDYDGEKWGGFVAGVDAARAALPAADAAPKSHTVTDKLRAPLSLLDFIPAPHVPMVREALAHFEAYEAAANPATDAAQPQQVVDVSAIERAIVLLETGAKFGMLHVYGSGAPTRNQELYSETAGQLRAMLAAAPPAPQQRSLEEHSVEWLEVLGEYVNAPSMDNAVKVSRFAHDFYCGAPAPKQAEARENDGLHFNAQRLRNVAALVGVTVDGDDTIVDAVRGVILGRIADVLRRNKQAEAQAEPIREGLPPLPQPAMPHGSRDYFSAGQMHDYGLAARATQPDAAEVRKQALEEAAKICDWLMRTYVRRNSGGAGAQVCDYLARCIRTTALSNKKGGDHG